MLPLKPSDRFALNLDFYVLRHLISCHFTCLVKGLRSRVVFPFRNINGFFAFSWLPDQKTWRSKGFLKSFKINYDIWTFVCIWKNYAFHFLFLVKKNLWKCKKLISTAKSLVTCRTITAARAVLYLMAVFSINIHARCRLLLLGRVITDMFFNLLLLSLFLSSLVFSLVISLCNLICCFKCNCWLKVALMSLGTFLMEAKAVTHKWCAVTLAFGEWNGYFGWEKWRSAA